MQPHNHTTHFGYKEVNENDKKNLVAEVFSNVAAKYDIMNDLMSFGLHRLWKAEMIKSLAPARGMKYLDVAGGSGDIGFKVAAKGADVTLTDINPEMLEEARKKSIDTGRIKNLSFEIADAEKLQFKTGNFDILGIAFGIRNVTHIDKALAEFFRVLKPGGKFVCLEFSNVENEVLRKIYDTYSFNIIPKIGSVVAGDESSYQYLVESIRKFPPAAKFEEMISTAGFKKTSHKKLTHGVVALHWGYKC